MKIVQISYPNQKGQIVIPKKIREELAIDQETPLQITLYQNQISIAPIKKTILRDQANSSYQAVLDATRGAWTNETLGTNKAKKKRTLELKASKKRKQAW